MASAGVGPSAGGEGRRWGGGGVPAGAGERERGRTGRGERERVPRGVKKSDVWAHLLVVGIEWRYRE